MQWECCSAKLRPEKEGPRFPCLLFVDGDGTGKQERWNLPAARGEQGQNQESQRGMSENGKRLAEDGHGLTRTDNTHTAMKYFCAQAPGLRAVLGSQVPSVRSLAAGTSAGQGSRQGQALGALCHRGRGEGAVGYGGVGKEKGGGWREITSSRWPSHR